MRSLLVVAVVAASVATGCAVGVAGSATLPTHRELDSYPAALLDAVLVVDGSCLYADAADGSGRWLPIWPPDFSLAGNEVLQDGRPIASVGSRVKLGGGEYGENEYAFLRSLMTDDVPAPCRGGPYWLVGPGVTLVAPGQESSSRPVPTSPAGSTSSS